MDITVIVCTFNRADLLDPALRSVALSKIPAGTEWEVLVVDNNSTDGTREVVERLSADYPGRFRYVFEPRQGKSHALNTAIREARGRIFAFTDDDVTVADCWLWNLTACLAGEEWAGSGGRTLPSEPFSPPRWLAVSGPYDLSGVLYAHFDLGENPLQLDRAPYGANMAFRRVMFEKYGPFRTDIGPGPNPDIPRFNEDTEFGRRLMAAGERLRYEPFACAYHRVPRERINREFFLTCWFDRGRSDIRELGERPDILGIPRRYFSIPKSVARTALQALQWVVAVHPQKRFFLKAHVWWLAGQTVERFRQSQPGFASVTRRDERSGCLG